jgi:hypothetical protein
MVALSRRGHARTLSQRLRSLPGMFSRRRRALQASVLPPFRGEKQFAISERFMLAKAEIVMHLFDQNLVDLE